MDELAERGKAEAIRAFIDRWRASGASERSNYQLFLTQLCTLLDLPQPEPAKDDNVENAYVFERGVTFDNGNGTTSPGFIDLYKRDCFVLEAKQGSEADEQANPVLAALRKRREKRRGTAKRATKAWDEAMIRARGQAESYAKALPHEEGWPPFLVVVDVGHVFEIYADFTRSGKAYTPFPDPRSYRIKLEDLAAAEARTLLCGLWLDPLELDPSRRSARVTRDVAARLAALAKTFEGAGHAPKSVADFLMRCLFTMFAEDVGLLPKGGFTALLKSLRGSAATFQPMAKSLWQHMNKGGFSPELREELLAFNGGLFENAEALSLDEDQLELLIDAANSDWKDVEPAIFGTLLERALDPRERHKLGAHYTPRAYVERLVMPTVIEPLREEWANVQAAAVTLVGQGKEKQAVKQLQTFHRKLCATRVLDPACGSGNFLYVSLEHMKRLEGEVLNALAELDETQALLEFEGHSVSPEQFLGIEINPRAATIAEMVLWIGYLQWHFRTRSDLPGQPVLRKFKNITEGDAVLAYDRTELARDDDGTPVSRWDGRTTKKHPVTGEEVPDETARIEVLEYVNPRPAVWPEADYVVGNPPYIGVRRIRQSLGDSYVGALRTAYPEIPDTSDLVMYWWHKSASAVKDHEIERFGFITTNSIVQSYSRKVIEMHIANHNGGVEIYFAIPDHPWVDSADGAAVRIAMTVAGVRNLSKGSAILGRVPDIRDASEKNTSGSNEIELLNVPRISANLRSDLDLTLVSTLKSNQDVCFQGVVPAGGGFKLTQGDVSHLADDKNDTQEVIKSYVIGRDLTQRFVQKYIIDFFDFSESLARDRYPNLYQHIYDRVRPERLHNKRKTYREKWWIFAEPRPRMRTALADLPRFIVTPYTSKHRIFVWVTGSTLPDAMAYAIATNDAYILGVLSCRIHQVWAMAVGGRLGVGNDSRYTSTHCFGPFPFPDCSEIQKAQIRELGEQLDAHRKVRQAEHPYLTLTQMYNVLEKLRVEETLSDKEKDIHEKGLVSVLKQIHGDLDAAVFEAYGWPPDLSNEEILERLVALNKERAAEEARGLVRWLRPEYQNPEGGTRPSQVEAELAAAAPAKAKTKKVLWPAGLAEQARAVRVALGARSGPVSAGELAKGFSRAKAERVEEILETLAALGQARPVGEDRYTA